ncbi:hypothetical protein GCM10022408_18490 [Hymenobacter fastidiosus]|uniref:Uncharacterized protein n=1 Tax=Hymenobacter fastidiosus TaxID=486264 RepID=A0ABP7S5A9_9BACT
MPELLGVLAYGSTREVALLQALALVLRGITERLEHGEAVPELTALFAVAA